MHRPSSLLLFTELCAIFYTIASSSVCKGITSCVLATRASLTVKPRWRYTLGWQLHWLARVNMLALFGLPSRGCSLCRVFPVVLILAHFTGEESSDCSFLLWEADEQHFSALKTPSLIFTL